MSYPAREARKAAGLTAEAAAGPARVSVAYLLECERKCDFPLVLAQRLAFLYGTDLRAFLPQPGSKTLPGCAQRGRGGRRTSLSHRGSATVRKAA